MHAATRAPRLRAPWLVVTLAAIGVIALAVGVVNFAPSSCASDQLDLSSAAFARVQSARAGPAASSSTRITPVPSPGPVAPGPVIERVSVVASTRPSATASKTC